MTDASAMIREWLPSVTSVSTLVIAARIAWQSRSYFDDLKTARRVGVLVEGDREEHGDSRKRYGIVGQVTTLEGAAVALAKEQAHTAASVKAMLRGMDLPSDLSSPDELEVLVKRRISDAGLEVDRLRARRSMVEEQAKRQSFPSHEEIERERAEKHRPALDRPFRTPALEAPNDKSWKRATGRREPPIERHEPPDSGEDDGQ